MAARVELIDGAGVDAGRVAAEMPMTMPTAIPMTTHQNASFTALDTSQNIRTATFFSVPDPMVQC
ncbi:MAG TPA: hypothetical protein VH333_12350 [Pseudonocardiaceae bacterium]|jgi:hypothetical protein|nr:hypothetical protein [Pseudonocardiaceae bacterium]